MPHQHQHQVLFLEDLKLLFAKHGKPKPEDHSAAILHLLVLQLEAMEVLLTSMVEVKGLANSQADKLSQLEADTNALIAKVGGGSGGTTPGGLTVTQEDLDAVGATLTSNNGRIDALVSSVLTGTQTPAPPPANPPTTPAPSLSPGVQTTPLAQATATPGQ